MIRAVQGKKVHGVKDVERELKKHAGKKVLFEIEKKREKAKTYTSVKHMDAMAITKLIYGVDTTVPPIYGHIPGIRIGDQFFGRNPTSCVGLHRPHMTGICFPTWMNKNVGKKDNVASMGIVMSGGYEDDEELEDGQSNSEDQFWYTGDGGNDVLASCSQTSDQKDERGNRALIRSSETGLPVRVNRGVVGPSGKTITYNGLYKVEKFTFAEGKSGHKVYRFHMVRLNKGQSKLVNKDTILHKMVGNQSDKYARWKRDYFVNDFIDPKTGKRKDRKEFSNPTKRPRIKNPHLICEDISNGQERRPIPVFNEVDSEQLPPDFEYTAKSLLIGDATSFKAQHEYPSIESIKQVDECPCVQLTAKDGNIANGSRGEGYHAGAGLWGARDVIYECYGCAHSTLGGLLQNRVVQTG
jgi:euchromatic histone-lysine N-methyltransferase